MTVEVMAVGAHPDDVELACGGTLALLAASRRVGIVHLTSGEAGTRGSGELRRREAEAAATALGCSELEVLDCGDGRLRNGELEEDALIGLIRSWRPELVLGPPASDRHPDHGRAHALVRDACFYAGVAKRSPRPGLEPHRPAAVFDYMQHDSFEPSFVVDVTSTWEVKMAALDAYTSQLAGRDGSVPEGAPTKVASPDFRRAVEGRARHWGMLAGVTFGEAFSTRGPLAVADPWSLVPGGLR